MKPEFHCNWPQRLTWGTLFILLACGNAQAQNPLQQGGELPEALKGIAPAGASCRRDDANDTISSLQNSATMPPAKSTALDLGCARAPQEIAAWLSRPETLLIDLRPPAQYQVFHVQDAINLSLSHITTKPYLRNKTLVLMGSGKAEAEVYRGCHRLKKAGYPNVFVLQGGMIAWQLAGYALQGKPPITPDDLLRLSIAEFWKEAQASEKNLILLEKGQEAFQTLLPDSMLLKQSTPDALRASLAGIRQRQPLTGVLLIASPDITPNHLREMRQAAHPLPLLLYTGSKAEYSAYAAQQEAIWSAHALGPKRPKCGS
jgi:rhodanese-related sulfurtransferase